MTRFLKQLLFAVLLSPVGVAFALPNWDFEAPQLGDRFQYFPDRSVASWEFPQGDGAGISGPGSPFTYANDLTGRKQVAFIQGHGAFATNVLLQPGDYIVTFTAAQRGADQFGTQTILVMVDGVERGRFTPLGPSMENYSTAEFTLDSTRSYRLELKGAGNGADFTAFIDDVTVAKVEPMLIKTDVASKSTPGMKCDSALADFGVNFAPPTGNPYAPVVRVRYMSDSIVSATSWYDASVNTLVDEKREGCARGPYATPTAPNNQLAQTTIQWVGDEVGFLVLGRDSKSKNPHIMFGNEDYPTAVFPWTEAGDALEFEFSGRLTMVNILHRLGVIAPVGHFYFGLNAMDTTTGKVLQFSTMAFDTRPQGKVNACDQYAGADGPHAVIQTTFSAHPVGMCDSEKIVWVEEQGTSPAIMGGGQPENGAWREYRHFKARLTTEGLVKAIAIANEKQGGFSTNPAHYRRHAAVIIYESIKFDDADDIDAAVSFKGLKVKVHKAQ